MNRQPPYRCLPLLAFFALAMSITPPARAQATDAPPTADAALAQLDAPAYADRQAATRRLLQDDTLTEDQLVDWYAQADSLEARQRLLAIARHHVLRRTREQFFGDRGPASLGVSHMAVSDTGLGRPIVQVRLTLPGLPAYAWLEPGDRILAVDGQPLTADAQGENFRRIIQAHRPGQSIMLTLQRHGQTIEQPVQLASAAALRAMYQQTTLRLLAPFATNWAKGRARMIQAGPPAKSLSTPGVGG